MNREIKFRGRDAKGVWHFGDLAHSQAVTETGLQPRVTVGGYEINEDTVGQYICIKDRKAFEIYEDDILHIVTDEGVEYNTQVHEYGQIYFETDESDASLLDDAKELIYEYIVIGNKFDNPELLNSELL